MPSRGRFGQRIQDLKAETYALYLAARHPETPWYAKLLVAGIVAYAASPIDLIPDFIPFVGFLDDLVLIPIGIVMARRMIPASVLAECRARARQLTTDDQPASRIAGLVLMVIWIGLAVLLIGWAYEALSP